MRIQNVLLSGKDLKEAIQEFLKKKGIDLEVEDVAPTYERGFTHKVSFVEELPEPPLPLPTLSVSSAPSTELGDGDPGF